MNTITIDQLNALIEKKELHLHHTASKRGYISRKGATLKAKEYAGKFGTGYTVERPRWDSSQYIYIDYYIK